MDAHGGLFRPIVSLAWSVLGCALMAVNSSFLRPHPTASPSHCRGLPLGLSQALSMSVLLHSTPRQRVNQQEQRRSECNRSMRWPTWFHKAHESGPVLTNDELGHQTDETRELTNVLFVGQSGATQAVLLTHSDTAHTQGEKGCWN